MSDMLQLVVGISNRHLKISKHLIEHNDKLKHIGQYSIFVVHFPHARVRRSH